MHSRRLLLATSSSTHQTCQWLAVAPSIVLQTIQAEGLCPVMTSPEDVASHSVNRPAEEASSPIRRLLHKGSRAVSFSEEIMTATLALSQNGHADTLAADERSRLSIARFADSSKDEALDAGSLSLESGPLDHKVSVGVDERTTASLSLVVPHASTDASNLNKSETCKVEDSLGKESDRPSRVTELESLEGSSCGTASGEEEKPSVRADVDSLHVDTLLREEKLSSPRTSLEASGRSSGSRDGDTNLFFVDIDIETPPDDNQDAVKMDTLQSPSESDKSRSASPAREQMVDDGPGTAALLNASGEEPSTAEVSETVRRKDLGVAAEKSQSDVEEAGSHGVFSTGVSGKVEGSGDVIKTVGQMEDGKKRQSFALIEELSSGSDSPQSLCLSPPRTPLVAKERLPGWRRTSKIDEASGDLLRRGSGSQQRDEWPKSGRQLSLVLEARDSFKKAKGVTNAGPLVPLSKRRLSTRRGTLDAPAHPRRDADSGRAQPRKGQSVQQSVIASGKESTGTSVDGSDDDFDVAALREDLLKPKTGWYQPLTTEAKDAHLDLARRPRARTLSITSGWRSGRLRKEGSLESLMSVPELKGSSTEDLEKPLKRESRWSSMWSLGGSKKWASTSKLSPLAEEGRARESASMRKFKKWTLPALRKLGDPTPIDQPEYTFTESLFRSLFTAEDKSNRDSLTDFIETSVFEAIASTQSGQEEVLWLQHKTFKSLPEMERLIDGADRRLEKGCYEHILFKVNDRDGHDELCHFKRPTKNKAIPLGDQRLLLLTLFDRKLHAGFKGSILIEADSPESNERNDFDHFTINWWLARPGWATTFYREASA